MTVGKTNADDKQKGLMKHSTMGLQKNEKEQNAASGQTQGDKLSFQKLRGILTQLSRLRDEERAIDKLRCLYSHSCTEQTPCTKNLRKLLDEKKKRKELNVPRCHGTMLNLLPCYKKNQVQCRSCNLGRENLNTQNQRQG